MKTLMIALGLALMLRPAGAQKLLTLEESINRALENNLALKSLRMEVDAAQLRVKQAWSGFLPQVSVSSNYSKMQLPSSQEMALPMPVAVDPATWQIIYQDVEFAFFPEEQYDTKIQLVLPIFLGGMRFKGLNMARLQKQMQDDALAVEKKNTILQVKEIYYNLLKIQEAVRIAEENRELVNSHLGEAKNFMDKGIYTRAQVLNYEVQVKEAEERLLSLQNTMETARLGFANLLGLEGTDFGLEPAGDTSPGEITRERAVASALENRTELKQLGKVVSLSEEGVGMARSKFLPNFNIMYSYGWQEEKYEFKDDTWMFAASMDINIFAGGSDYLKVKEAKIKVEKAKNDLENLRRGLKLQTETAYLQYKQAQKTNEVTEERLKAAEESYTMVTKSFEQGMVNELTEKDARLGLSSAQMAVAGAKYDLLIARARLDNAMGVAEWTGAAEHEAWEELD